MQTNEGAPVPDARRSYHEQLEEIRGDVVKVAAKTCEQIGAATQAMLDNTDGSLELNLQLIVDDADISADNVDFTVEGYVLLLLSVLSDD